MFPEQHLVTVWSAPNYCYRCGNVASILIFDDSLQRDVRYFTETAENSTMMAPRVRCGGRCRGGAVCGASPQGNQWW